MSGRVKSLFVEQAVLVLIGHVLDVLEEAEGGVLVGVLFEGRVAQELVEAPVGVGDARIIFAFDDRRLGLDHVLGVIQVDEPVGLGLDDFLQVLPAGEDDEVAGEVVGRIAVGARAEPGQELVVGGPGDLFRALEHHVLEEMGEPRFPGLDLVAGARPDDGVIGDDVRVAERDGDDLEPVLQLLDLVVVGKDLRRLALGRTRERGEEPDEGQEDEF